MTDKEPQFTRRTFLKRAKRVLGFAVTGGTVGFFASKKHDTSETVVNNVKTGIIGGAIAGGVVDVATNRNAAAEQEERRDTHRKGHDHAYWQWRNQEAHKDDPKDRDRS